MMVKRYFVHFTDMVKDVISIPASKVCDYKESVSHTDYQALEQQLEKAEAQNKVLMDASEFYAATGNWCDSPGRLMEGVSEIEKDGGKRAQQALKLTVKEAIKDAD